jgi:hypothetical protein
MSTPASSDDLVGAMLSSQEASLSFSMLMQVRNKVMGGLSTNSSNYRCKQMHAPSSLRKQSHVINTLKSAFEALARESGRPVAASQPAEKPVPAADAGDRRDGAWC